MDAKTKADLVARAEAEAARLKAEGWTKKDFTVALWNPRYVLWAKKHGLTPEQMVEKDNQDWPGGCMTGFSLWIQERMRALCAFHNVKDTRELPTLLKKDHQIILDNWLEASIL